MRDSAGPPCSRARTTHCGSTWDRVSTQFLDSIGVPIVRGRRFHQPGHGHLSAGGHRESDICQEVLSKSRSRSASTSASTCRSTRRQFEIVGVFADFKMNNPREAGPPGLSAPARAAVHRLQGADHDFNRDAIHVHERDDRSTSTVRSRMWMRSFAARWPASIPTLRLWTFARFDAQVAGNFNQERLSRGSPACLASWH